MTGLSQYSAENVLNYVVGKTAMPALLVGPLVFLSFR